MRTSRGYVGGVVLGVVYKESTPLQLFSKMPDVSVECASNVVHFRMCEDSCVALCDMLHYISSQQDLAQPPPILTTADYCTLPTSLPPPPPPPSSAPVGGGSGSPLTACHDLAEGGGTTDIGDLISDAMEDSSHTDPGGGVNKVSRGPKMLTVHVSGESLLMDFDSDSDTEESAGLRSEGKSRPLSSSTHGDAARGKLDGRGRLDLNDIFSDSDDDFCIVNTPTSTRVVSVTCTCAC